MASSSEQNKNLMRQYIEEAWNKGDLSFIDKNLADDFVNHSTSPGHPTDKNGVKWIISTMRKASPDIHFIIEHMIAEGDKVATRWVAQGTHTGELMGMPPTGKKVTVTATVIERTGENGKVKEHWGNRDDLGLLQQIGIIPPSGTAAR